MSIIFHIPSGMKIPHAIAISAIRLYATLFSIVFIIVLSVDLVLLI